MKFIFIKTGILILFIFVYSSPLKAQIVVPTISHRVTTVSQVLSEDRFEEMTPFSKPEPALTSEQKSLLEEGLKWVDHNLKCIQKGESPRTWSKFPDGKCFEVWKVLFGNFTYPALMLDVSGDSQLAAHGAMLADEKFIFCAFSNGAFSAKVFEKKDGGSSLRLVKFKKGADLVWIGDRVDLMGSEGPSKAHVYREVHGEMKEVLTYEYSEREEGVEYPEGMETILIPQENKDIALLKLTIRNSFNSENEHQQDTSVTETHYRWNLSDNIYTKDGIEKVVPNKIWETEKGSEAVESDK